MAKNIIHDSSWASLWVKDYNAGSDAGALPAVGAIVIVGNKVGVVIDTPKLREDGNYWCTIDTAAEVRVSGVSGTATDGATVYHTGSAITLTASTNTPIGYLTQPKAATGDDLFVQLVPGATLPVKAS